MVKKEEIFERAEISELVKLPDYQDALSKPDKVAYFGTINKLFDVKYLETTIYSKREDIFKNKEESIYYGKILAPEMREGKDYSYEANQAFWAGLIEKQRPLLLLSPITNHGRPGTTSDEMLWLHDNGYQFYSDLSDSDKTWVLPPEKKEDEIIIHDYNGAKLKNVNSIGGNFSRGRNANRGGRRTNRNISTDDNHSIKHNYLKNELSTISKSVEKNQQKIFSKFIEYFNKQPAEEMFNSITNYMADEKANTINFNANLLKYIKLIEDKFIFNKLEIISLTDLIPKFEKILKTVINQSGGKFQFTIMFIETLTDKLEWSSLNKTESEFYKNFLKTEIIEFSKAKDKLGNLPEVAIKEIKIHFQKLISKLIDIKLIPEIAECINVMNYLKLESNPNHINKLINSTDHSKDQLTLLYKSLADSTKLLTKENFINVAINTLVEKLLATNNFDELSAIYDNAMTYEYLAPEITNIMVNHFIENFDTFDIKKNADLIEKLSSAEDQKIEFYKLAEFLFKSKNFDSAIKSLVKMKDYNMQNLEEYVESINNFLSTYVFSNHDEKKQFVKSFLKFIDDNIPEENHDSLDLLQLASEIKDAEHYSDAVKLYEKIYKTISGSENYKPEGNRDIMIIFKQILDIKTQLKNKVIDLEGTFKSIINDLKESKCYSQLIELLSLKSSKDGPLETSDKFLLASCYLKNEENKKAEDIFLEIFSTVLSSDNENNLNKLSEKLIKVAETTGEIENERKDKLLNHALNCTYKLLISTSEGNSEKKGELTNKFRETYKKISDKKNITLLIDGNNKNFQDLFPDDKSTYTNK